MEFSITNIEGLKFIVYYDKRDHELISKYNWFVTCRERYAVANTFKKGIRKQIKMHRLILGLTDPKIMTDHIDHNGLNNRRNNLRVCNQRQNILNKQPKKNGASKYLGVFRFTNRKLNKPWLAQIRSNNKVYYLGFFKSEEEAALVYDLAAKKYHGEFANLNFK